MLEKFSFDLKKYRESKNIPLSEVAAQTKLHIAFLENIEKGNFDFQPQPYIRAFLKQYAKAVGIDPDNVLKDYDLAKIGKYVSPFPSGEDTKSEAENISSEPEPEEKSFPVDEVTEKNSADHPSLKEIDENADENFSGRPSFHKDKDDRKFRREHFISADDKVRRSEKSVSGRSSQRSEHSRKIRDDKPKVKSNPKINVSSPLVKNLLLLVFVLIVIFGLYSFVNILLKESNNNHEVVKQNFDDIVKEQEQRILGKKSEEEIQDSIVKAEEKRLREQEMLDSITLKVISIAPGSMTVGVDSSGMKKPDKVTYGNNEIGIFKAKHFFTFTNDNTSSIKVTLNDKPIEFESKKVAKVKITRDGVVQ